MDPSLDFDALFDTHYPRLYAYLRSRVNSRETAEDLTAATFERAFSRRQSFDPNKASFPTWLFTIGRNLVINHFTAASRQSPAYGLEEAADISAPTLSPEQQLLREEQRRILAGSLTILSERDQEVIQLKFFGRLTNRQIAKVMELNEKTVSVIIFRALQKLKLRLEREEAL